MFLIPIASRLLFTVYRLLVMFNAIIAQWIILRKRPLTWVLFGVYLLLFLVQMFAPVGILGIAPQLGNALNADAAAALRQTVRLPFAFATIFGQINGFGGLLLMILAGAFVGGDWTWNIPRVFLVRNPSRLRYVGAKFAALSLMAAVWVLVSVPLGFVCAWLASVMLGLESHVALNDLPLVGRGILISWLGLLPYLLLATMWAVVGRSAVAGIAGSIGYWLLEIGFGAVSILQMLGDFGAKLYNFSLAQSIGAWTNLTRMSFQLDVGRAFGQLGFSFPSLTQASVMIVIYCGMFAGMAWWGLRRR